MMCGSKAHRRLRAVPVQLMIRIDGSQLAAAQSSALRDAWLSFWTMFCVADSCQQRHRPHVVLPGLQVVAAE